MKRLLAFGVAAIGVTIGAAMNAWFGYSKGGDTGEAWPLLGLTITVGPGLVLAGLFVVFDIVKVTLPGRIEWHCKRGEVREARRWRIRFYALCVLSFTSALGFGLTLNENLRGSHASSSEKLALLKAEQSDLERRLAALGDQPGFDQQIQAIEARLATMRVERRWQSTGGCDPRQTTARKSIRFCKRYREIEGEAGLAGEAQRLRSRLTEVRQQVSWASSTRVMRAADPQAAILAQLPWLDQQMAGALIMVLLALVSELMLANIWHWAAGFGAKPDAPNRRNQRLRHQTTKSSTETSVTPQLVVDNTRRAPNCLSGSNAMSEVLAKNFCFGTAGDMQASKAYEHYVTACVSLGLDPKSNNWFSAQLISIGVERVTRNGRRFYVGLAPNEQMLARAA